MPNHWSAEDSTETDSSPLFIRVAHHGGQQALRLGIVSHATEEIMEILLHAVKDRRGKAPEIHGHHAVAVQLMALAVGHVGDAPSGNSWIFSVSRISVSFPSAVWHTPRDTVPYWVTVFFKR